jgi:hypothetical protein
MDIWQFQMKITDRLGIWAIISMLMGILMSRSSRKEVQGAGKQFLGWGIVNAGIAGVGKISAARQLKNIEDPQAPGIVHQETKKLSRLLWLNSALDILYILGGARLMKRRRDPTKSWYGQGIGIMLQGGFLFFFDLIHVLRLESILKTSRG